MRRAVLGKSGAVLCPAVLCALTAAMVSVKARSPILLAPHSEIGERPLQTPCLMPQNSAATRERRAQMLDSAAIHSVLPLRLRGGGLSKARRSAARQNSRVKLPETANSVHGLAEKNKRGIGKQDSPETRGPKVLECATSAECHDALITCLQYHNGYVYTGSIDRTVRVWDARSGQVCTHEP